MTSTPPDAPPPVPGASEPLQPTVIPAGEPLPGPGSNPGPSNPGPIPPGAATRSPVLLLAVAIVAAVGIVVNSVGLAGFPSNAPVEMLYALGINVDLLAIAIACGIGAALSRRGYPLRSKTPLTVVAVVLAGVAFLAWAALGGIASVIELVPPSRGRYMSATGGLFLLGAPFVLATVFGAHGYRRRGERRNNVLAIVALGVAGLLAAYALFSSVIYGLGITD